VLQRFCRLSTKYTEYQQRKGNTVKSIKKQLTGREVVLGAAHELILRDGLKSLDIKELAARSKMTRANIYLIFGSEPRSVIYESIIGEFLQRAQNSITTALITSPPNFNNVEKLASILRVTLHFFHENPQPGKVVLLWLDMSHSAYRPIRQIFKHIDHVVDQAIKKDEIIVGFSSVQIRQILFAVMYGLLRAFYLEEEQIGVRIKKEVMQTFVHRGVLQVLSGLCSAHTRAQIDEQINALPAS